MPQVDDVLTAVAYPIRREILRRLAERPRRAGDLARGFAVSRPAICKHAAILQRAGLIRAAKSGRVRMYELAPEAGAAMRAAADEIEELSAYWDMALEAFKRIAEESR
ncbi:MAG: winged helix-turn-helix transcriptional regulator [Alphaproteobacteria bacterium]|nr:winged helix-turn-helix transcriptional regulator [Alphaproteobacteria bacterium]